MDQDQLRYSHLWFRVGIIGLLSISVMALWPYQLHDSLPRWTDKALHAGAYVVLAGWFFLVYQRGWQRWLIAGSLFSFGFAIELAQYFSPVRDASLFDLVANVSGIGVAWLICLTPLRRTLHVIETRLFGAQRA